MTNRQKIYYDGEILNLARGFIAAGFSKDNLSSLERVFTEVPDLNKLLENPGVLAGEKKTIIDKIFTTTIEASCLKYLVDRGQVGNLRGILEAVQDLLLKDSSSVKGLLSYAKEPPSQEQLHAMEKAVVSQGNFGSVDWEFVLVPELLDGFTLEVDGVFYDYSLNGSFNKLLNHLNRR